MQLTIPTSEPTNSAASMEAICVLTAFIFVCDGYHSLYVPRRLVHRHQATSPRLSNCAPECSQTNWDTSLVELPGFTSVNELERNCQEVFMTQDSLSLAGPFSLSEVKWILLSRVWPFETPWTIQSMECSRPEYWSGLPFPSSGDLPNPGIEPRSPDLLVDSLPSEPPGKPSLVKSACKPEYD